MKITGFIIGIIGVMLIGLGAYLFVHEQLFLQSAELSTATVTANIRHAYTGNVQEYGVQHYYCSRFQFQTKAGQSVSFTHCSSTADAPPDYQIGQQEDVYYDPQDPGHTAQIRNTIFKYRYSAAIAATAVGALCILVGLWLFEIRHARGPRQMA
jgi:hypothetical protein